MGLFFGTDGLRGKVDETLTAKIAFRCGNALARVFENEKKLKNKACKILLGTDTRGSADYLAMAFASGAISAGANVTFVGVCPTAGIGFLTKLHSFDYGVIISASHNEASYNGIKIFNRDCQKLNEDKIRQIEKNMLASKVNKCNRFGKFEYNKKLLANYKAFLIESVMEELKTKSDFENLKIVLDLSNGAGFKIAPKVFKFLRANVKVIHARPNGRNINKNCGALFIESLRQKVLSEGADVGFAFDGDSDRVIAVAENGKVIDGDQIIYILASFYKEQSRLKKAQVVCTKHTNMGIEQALKEKGINMLRTDIGDKFVNDELDKNGLVIGGEKAGHIFLKDKLETGDGILTALILTCILKEKNQKLSELMCENIYPQVNKNIPVKNKEKILENQCLKTELKILEKTLSNGRLFVRASGTEPVVRVVVEERQEEICEFVSEKLETLIKKIDTRGGLCVE